MSSVFKKILKRIAPKPEKLTPKFVKKSEILTKLSHSNIVYRSIYQNRSIATAPKWSDTRDMRARLRAEHELSTTPGSKTSSKIYQRDQMPEGPERDALTAEINAYTLKRGHVGIVVGAAAVGGAAGTAIGAGGGALAKSDVAGIVKDAEGMVPYEYERISDPTEIYSGDTGSQTAKKPVPATAGNSNAGLWLMGGLVLLKILL